MGFLAPLMILVKWTSSSVRFGRGTKEFHGRPAANIIDPSNLLRHFAYETLLYTFDGNQIQEELHSAHIALELACNSGEAKRSGKQACMLDSVSAGPMRRQLVAPVFTVEERASSVWKRME